MKYETMMRRCKPGRRVYLIGRPIGVTMFCDSGTVIGPDEDDYCIIHLDVPGIYHNGVGRTDPLPDICYAYDDLATSRIEYWFVRLWRRTISLPFFAYLVIVLGISDWHERRHGRR